MKYKAYPKYKDSGVEWLGMVPEGWEVKKLGLGVQTIVPMRDKPEDLSGEIPWIRIEDFEGRYISESKSSQGISLSTISAMNLKIFPIDTVLCTCSCSMGTIAIVKKELVTNQTFIGLVPEKFLPEFLAYLMESSQKELTRLATGAIQTYLSKNDFSNLRVVFPPLPTQISIAQFLDTETAKIDRLIADNNDLIALLQEKRKALISHAVTRGLSELVSPDDPEFGEWAKPVKFKDSGVEWLGMVPEGWEVKAIKHIVDIPVSDGPHETPDILEEGIPFISAEAIKNDKVDFEKKRGFISIEDHERFSKKFFPKKDDIFMVKSGATTGNIAIVETDEVFNIWSPLAVIRSNKSIANHRFVFWAMKSKFFTEQVINSWSFGTQQNIGMGIIENLCLVFPNILLQERIATFLDASCSKIERLIEETNQSIELLKEHRSSLITNAVTGKIKVD